MVDALTTPELTAAWHVGAQRRRITVLAALATLSSLAFAGLVLLFQFVPVLLLIAWMVLIVIAWWPRAGLYVACGLVLFFEGLSNDPLMLPGRYLYGGLSGLVVWPFELLLLLTFVSWLAQGIARRRFDFRGGRLSWPMLLFFAAFVFGMVRGPVGGGSPYIASWEARPVILLFICYVLASNTIRTRRHLRTLLTIVLLTTSLFAVDGIWRYSLFSSGRLNQSIEGAWPHEDTIFLGALVLLVLAQRILGGPRWQRVLGPLILPIAGYTLLATQRRAGYIALMVAFLAFAFVFLVTHRKAFLFTVAPVLVGWAIYLPLFWTNAGLLGQPARSVRSLTEEADARDAGSNLYRDLEKIDLRATIHADPLLGIGFGREFLWVVPLPDLSFWPFWHYEPHNSILWIWLKTGAIGFILFWVLMGTAIARAGHFARTLREPDERTFALLALGVVISSLVFCYVDTGLYTGRLTAFLGTIMGTLAVLDRVHEEGRPRAAQAARVPAVGGA